MGLCLSMSLPCAHCVTVVVMVRFKCLFRLINRKFFNYILNMKQSNFLLLWNIHISRAISRQLPYTFGTRTRSYDIDKYSDIGHCQ